ncbi:MAG: DUF4843 domain-containing protein [Marinifilaceae bacterium]
MNKLKYITLSMLCFAACSEDKLDVFTNPQSSIYFSISSGGEKYTEQTKYSFLETIEGTDTVNLNVALLGLPSDVERYIDFTVVADSSTAVAGDHYDFVANPAPVAAGANSANIQVIVKRHESLQDSDFSLRIQLLDNEHFTVAPKEEYLNITTGEKVVLHSHNVFITGKIALPDMRRWNGGGFGTYSVKKHLLVNEINNLKASDWESAYPHVVTIWSVKTRNHLQRQYDMGAPIYEDELDENGEPVLMRVNGVNF